MVWHFSFLVFLLCQRYTIDSMHRLIENLDTEFKSCENGALPDNLWQPMSAFANTRGGKILLGVSDDGREIGLSREILDKLQKDVSTLISNDKFNRPISVNIECNGAWVELDIKESPFYDKPIFSKKVGEKKVYIRQGATTVLATDEQKKSMFAGASGGGENQPVNGNIKELVDDTKVDEYISKTGLAGIDGLDTETKLTKLKALREGKLTVFGLIGFGVNNKIDETLNNVYIDFRYFAGTSKVGDDLTKIYNERNEFHGDIRKQFIEAFEHIKSKLPVEGTLNAGTGLREDQYILPEAALREALANAIAHRDYSISNSCVNVDLYSDRIELSNPGESLVAIDDLDKTDSKARNPNLMEMLKVFKITDKSARGILTIKQAARNKGLLDPLFENISGSFKATLFFSSPHSNKDKEWVKDIADRYSLKDTQQNALVHIKNHGSISNREYCDVNHMTSVYDDRKARRELNEMMKYGIIRVEGRGPGTKYVLSD